MPRMQILTLEEQRNFNSPPLFNHTQRKLFFDFPKKLLDIAHTLRNSSNQIGFLLLCGYFRAARRFFSAEDFNEKDVRAVANILKHSASIFISHHYKKATRIRHQQIIVEYYGFQEFDKVARGLIEIIELLNSKGVDLISLDLRDRVDTTSPMGRAFFQIAGVFAELERSMINARTKAGIAKAKLDGVKFGRTLGSTNKKTASKIEKIKIFISAGKSYDWIAKELSVSKKTISDVKKSVS